MRSLKGDTVLAYRPRREPVTIQDKITVKDLEFMLSYPLLDHRPSQKPLTDAVCALLLWGTKDRKEPTVIFTYFLLNTYTIENRSLNQKFNNKEAIRIIWL